MDRAPFSVCQCRCGLICWPKVISNKDMQKKKEIQIQVWVTLSAERRDPNVTVSNWVLKYMFEKIVIHIYMSHITSKWVSSIGYLLEMLQRYLDIYNEFRYLIGTPLELT
jgi:hypothetical protein